MLFSFVFCFDALWQRTCFDDSCSSGWIRHAVPDGLLSSPSAVSPSPGQIKVFATMSDSSLGYLSFSSGTWAKRWATLGGKVTSAPGAVSTAPGQVTVFVRGVDLYLYSKAFGSQGTWSRLWSRIDTSREMSSAPSALKREHFDRVSVFARGRDRAIWELANVDGQWNRQWSRVGGVTH